MAAPSFSLRVREELARVQSDTLCCSRKELAGLVLGCGRLRVSSGERRLVLWTGQPFVARKILWLARRSGLRGRMLLARGGSRSKRFHFELVAKEADQALQFAGMLDREGRLRFSAPRVPRARCCRQAWLRGLFLSAGSVSDPDRSYHLEFDLLAGAADSCERLLIQLGYPARKEERQRGWRVYMKDAVAISELLQELGANEGRLTFEEAMIRSDRRNIANRQVNAETANLDKAAQASVRQIDAIRRLAQYPGLSALPEPLRLLAEARLREPDLSLRELGQRMHPPLSKSGVNHRMRRILRLAEG